MSVRRPDAVTPEDLLRCAFNAFNRRDADELLALVGDDVAWSSDAGMLNKGDLRSFWARQWSNVRTHDKVTHVERVSERDYLVSLDQEIRSLNGSLISSGSFRYGFVVENGRIAALSTRDPV